MIGISASFPLFVLSPDRTGGSVAFLEEKFKKEYSAFRVNKTRELNDISTVSFLYHHYAIQNGKAIVTLPSDQKSKAIGKSGINIRLASMLTGYTIELNEVGGTTQLGEKAPEEKKEGIGSLEALFGN